jgi:diketogulonate reductase-like aldo/keto reductase
VKESVSLSLASLGVTYIDCLVLHSLYPNIEDTLTAWKVMEALVPSKVSSLGLSNVDVKSLRRIYEAAKVKPRTIQNRFTEDTAPKSDSNMPPGLPYPEVAYDRDVREYCEKQGITYVPWGLLWGNPALMDDDPEQMLDKTAQAIGVSKQVVYYACMRCMGGCNVSILCGTTREARMQETLTGLTKLKSYLQESEEHKRTWQICVNHIRSIININ